MHPEEKGKIYYRHGMNCSSVKNILITEVSTKTRKAREIRTGLLTFSYEKSKDEKVQDYFNVQVMLLQI